MENRNIYNLPFKYLRLSAHLSGRFHASVLRLNRSLLFLKIFTGSEVLFANGFFLIGARLSSANTIECHSPSL